MKPSTQKHMHFEKNMKQTLGIQKMNISENAKKWDRNSRYTVWKNRTETRKDMQPQLVHIIIMWRYSTKFTEVCMPKHQEERQIQLLL